MAEEALPSDVAGFLDQYITSVEQLEILLLLVKNPERAYTVQSTYDVILSTKPSVEGWLDRFVNQQIVSREPASPPWFKYNRENAYAPTILALADAYRAMPVRVIEAIYRKQRRPAGPDPAQGFADAFRLRKD